MNEKKPEIDLNALRETLLNKKPEVTTPLASPGFLKRLTNAFRNNVAAVFHKKSEGPSLEALRKAAKERDNK